ncbi:hypothetical protein E1281_24900 [Actinomadura sp. KC345]|uniref:hypothetical protein n=1 Tax=Actinomadura sp. KC345 TaxID=2530371 RepID=UPI001051C627|nr:hypothetical protein [Actinomadura sp. KC345]TDC48393.1 hypothetical protein E1281_24900 [Actinomadura sp. KC345]
MHPEEIGEPLGVADPRLLGGFTVRGRLAGHAAGAVYSGRDPHGGPVVLVALAPAAASDPAVRDRFAAATAALGDRVLEAPPQGPPTWAALSREGGEGGAGGSHGLREATALLDAAGLTAGEARPGSGPGFVPHWSPSPDGSGPWSGDAPPAGAVPPPAGRAPPPSALKLTAIVTPVAGLVIVLVVLGAWIGWQVLSPARPAGPSTTPPPTTHAAPSGPPSAAPSKGSGPRGGKGPVAGPRYGEGEDTYHADLEGMPFDFDLPGGWGCLRSDKKPFDTRWVCIDEGGTFPPSGSGAGGFVAVEPCAAPCGDGERATLRTRFTLDEEDWRRIDATTMYAEIEGELPNRKGERQVRVAMSRVFGSVPGGGPGTAVAVQLTGPEEQRETMQKLINEIHDRTS